MHTFQTTDLRVVRRCRYAQLRGEKTKLTVNGTPVTGGGPFARGRQVVQPGALDHYGRTQIAHHSIAVTTRASVRLDAIRRLEPVRAAGVLFPDVRPIANDSGRPFLCNAGGKSGRTLVRRVLQTCEHVQ